MINDITTDLETPPPLTEAAKAPANAGKDLSYPESFKAVVREKYPDLQAKSIPLPAAKAFEATLSAAKAFKGFTIVREDPELLLIEGYQVSRLFRFVDDFVIRIRENDKGSSQVDMRSRSRVGKSDLGANAKRIRAFFSTF